MVLSAAGRQLIRLVAPGTPFDAGPQFFYLLTAHLSPGKGRHKRPFPGNGAGTAADHLIYHYRKDLGAPRSFHALNSKRFGVLDRFVVGMDAPLGTPLQLPARVRNGLGTISYSVKDRHGAACPNAQSLG